MFQSKHILTIFRTAGQTLGISSCDQGCTDVKCARGSNPCNGAFLNFAPVPRRSEAGFTRVRWLLTQWHPRPEGLLKPGCTVGLAPAGTFIFRPRVKPLASHHAIEAAQMSSGLTNEASKRSAPSLRSQDVWCKLLQFFIVVLPLAQQTCSDQRTY